MDYIRPLHARAIIKWNIVNCFTERRRTSSVR